MRQRKLVYVTQNQKMLKCGIFVPRLVLEVHSANNTLIISKPYGGPRQLWDFDGDGTIRSRFGNVLDIRGGKTEAMTPVIAHPKHGGWNQIFRVMPVSG